MTDGPAIAVMLTWLKMERERLAELHRKFRKGVQLIPKQVESELGDMLIDFDMIEERLTEMQRTTESERAGRGTAAGSHPCPPPVRPDVCKDSLVDMIETASGVEAGERRGGVPNEEVRDDDSFPTSECPLVNRNRGPGVPAPN